MTQKKQIKVLIVEDSPSDTDLLLDRLKDFKTMLCGVKQAVRIKDAEKLLEKEEFDAILLDLNLPDSNGLDSVKKIIEKRKKTPVIVMTGTGQQELIGRVLNMGVQNFIIKGEETAASLERAVIFSIEREKNIVELKKSKKMQEEIIKNSPVMMFVLDENGRAVSLNPEAEKFSGKNSRLAEGMLSGEVLDCINSFKHEKGCGHSAECAACPLAAAVRSVFLTGENINRKELKYTVVREGRPADKILLVSVVRMPINGSFGALVSVEDMTEIKASEEKYRMLYTSIGQGLALHEAVYDSRGKMTDYRFLEVNENFEKITGLKAADLIGRTVKEVLPDVEQFWIDKYAEVVKTGVPASIEGYSAALKKHYDSYAYRPKTGQFAALVSDITEKKKLETDNLFIRDIQEAVSGAGSLQDIYDIIAEKTQAFIGDSIVLISRLDNAVRGFRIASYAGLNEPIEKIVQAVKFDPTKIVYELDRIGDERLKPFRSGKLERIKGGLYEFGVGIVPKIVCDVLEKIIKADFLYVIGFVSKNTHFGSVNIICRRDISAYVNVIERVVQHVSLVIERKTAEEALRTSEEKYRQLYTSIGQGLALHEAIFGADGNMVDYRFIEVNDSFLKITGWTRDGIIGRTVREILPDVEPRWIEAYGRVALTGKPEYIEGYVAALKKHFGVYAYRPKPGQFAALVSDITGRKNAEEAVENYNKSLSGALDVMQRNTESVRELLDLALEQVIKITKSKIGYIYHYYEDKKQLVLNTWSKDVMKECAVPKAPTVYELDKTGIWGEAVRQRKPVIINDFKAENPLKKGYPGGNVKLDKFMTIPVVSEDQIVAVVGVANKDADYDDSDVLRLSLLMNSVWKTVGQKKIEEALKESEEKFRAAFEQAAVGMSYTAPDGRLLSVNERLCEIIGYTREEVEKMKFQDISFPEEAEKNLEAITKMKTGEISSYNTEKRYKKKDGSVVWVNLTSSAVRGPDKSIKFLISVIQDITERKRREAEERFFSDVQVEVSQAGTLLEIFRVIADKMRAFLGSGIMLVTYLDDKAKGFRVAAYSGLSDLTEKVIGIIKVDPRTILYRLDDIPDAFLKPFRTGKLTLLKEGIYDMALGTIPKPLCVMLQKFLKTDYGYVIGFVNDGKHFGSLDIISDRNIEEHRGVIERVIQYTSVVIKKKVAEAELKSSEEKWTAFTDSADDNLMLWDAELVLIAANASAKKTFQKMTGKELAVGKQMLELMGYLKSSSRYEKFREVVRAGEPFYVPEYTINSDPSNPRYYSLSAFKVGAGMGLITTDITDIRRSEIILKQSYEKLKDVDRLKSNFISIISHELRTPLTIIKGFTSFLIKEAAGPLNDNQKNFVNTIDTNTSRLARIINDMVDVSKIETGSFSVEKEKRELSGVINEAVDGMHHIVEERGITLETEIETDSAHAEVDKGRITQTITNLINNAMRFTGKGGTIKVSLKDAAGPEMPDLIAKNMNEEKNYYQICVADDGAGIDRKYLEKIFERFYQVENANTRKHQGAGLGLSIAKSIVEAHHGFIWAESEGLGKGTKVCIVIPE